MRRLTVIVKPTVLCNCSCKYCITPLHIPHSRMSLDTIERICQLLSKSSVYNDFCFIWHGGEPMLMGIDFYKGVIDIQNKILKHSYFTNTFQSNCTLINEDWLQFLKEHKIRVSTSLDGDRDLHNINRLKNDEGTFDETIEAIKRLQEEGLFGGVVTVLSKTNINYIDKMISFFATNNINARLNPILPCERTEKQQDLTISPMEYASCIIRCFDNWIDSKYPNGENINIAPLAEIIYNMTHDEKPRLCSFSGACGKNFIAFNPKGDIYNCGRFCDIDEFKIGNIQTIESIDDTIRKKDDLIRWKIDTVNDECSSCDWFKICNRGCPNTSYMFYGEIKEKDPYCSAYKRIFSHIYNRLKIELC